MARDIKVSFQVPTSQRLPSTLRQQLSPGLVDSRQRPTAEQPGDSARTALRIVDFIQLKVVHAQLFDWFDQLAEGRLMQVS